MVVGLQSDDMRGAVTRLHVVATALGATLVDEAISVTGSATFPKELRAIAPAGQPDATLEVSVEAFGPGAGGPAILRRTSAVRFEAGKTKLLRLHLEERCLTGALGGATCVPPTTCMAGTCSSAADILEDYAPNWPLDAPDICKPASHGDPQVLLGSGQTDYLAIADGQTLKAELGPQGGHHVWIAVRMRNLKQSGSTITLTAVQPTTGISVLSTAFVFSFERDEGGYCKLFGLRFQLDNGAADLSNDYKKFLGKPLDISAEVIDPAGGRAKATAHVTIDATLLCPSGLPGC